jgi:hypothetical protein
MRSRLATSLALAAILGAPGAALADDTGGASYDAPPLAALTPGGLVGGTVRWSGTLADARAGQVRIERFDDDTAAWSTVAETTAGPDGTFEAAWPGDRAGVFTVRAIREGDGAGDASAAPVTQVTVFRPARATWYGPGLYGRRLACGGRLATTTIGVAHRTLPCGTPVQVFFRGRSLVVPVVDRGPFANGASYDLTAATAQALGVRQTSRVGVAPRPPAATARRPKRG